jgi:predicted O-linked N-acetylglucosamine transferase (SPINDLY family)
MAAKFAHLPQRHLATRARRRAQVRREHKLPEDGVVLGCFNRALKIDPITFQVSDAFHATISA